MDPLVPAEMLTKMPEKMPRKMPSSSAVLAWLDFVAAQLVDKLADEAVREARLLLALAMKRDTPVLSHENLYLDDAAKTTLQQLINKRLAGWPISRLRGWREFYGLRFDLNAEVLDPRSDSETLIDAALGFAKAQNWTRQPLSLLDVGTGSGCLLLACLKHLPNATGVGTDVSQLALEQASANAARLGLGDVARFVRADWTEDNWSEAIYSESGKTKKRYHIILSNPPYIAATMADTLSDEVRHHDPHQALFAGADGLDAYRCLLATLPELLLPEGQVFLEVGHDQADAVAVLASSAGLRVRARHPDLAGIQRCLQLAQK